jgi:hypothetical protein
MYHGKQNHVSLQSFACANYAYMYAWTVFMLFLVLHYALHLYSYF